LDPTVRRRFLQRRAADTMSKVRPDMMIVKWQQQTNSGACYMMTILGPNKLLGTNDAWWKWKDHRDCRRRILSWIKVWGEAIRKGLHKALEAAVKD